MKTRQSNIELLRIISMIMILCVHFTGATFPLPSILDIKDLLSVNTLSKMTMESFAIIGVNCFVLISGYFGIKQSLKGIINFIIWCLFYSVGIYTLVAIIHPSSHNISAVLSSFGIFSHTDLWFIPSYFALYLISPIINNGIKNLKIKEFNLLILALTFLNVYLGWFWHGTINPNGYNTMQLIYIYIIGRYLKLFISTDSINRKKYIYYYIISFILIFTSTFFCKSTMAFAYNSPFVICASVSFFLIFTTFTFQNKLINSIAASAFAVYLIHKMPPVWSTLRDFLYNTTQNYNIVYFLIFWILYVLTIFIICILVDKIRIKITTPISNQILTLIQKII